MTSDNSNCLFCSRCARQMSYVPALAGTLVACPYCRYIFTMPSTSASQDGVLAESPDSSGPAVVMTGQGAMSLNEEQNASYIIHEPPRPAGVTIIAVMGIFVSGMVLLWASSLVAYHFFSVDLPFKDNVPGPGESITISLLMVFFLATFVGLLRGSKIALWAYMIMTILIAVVLITNCARQWQMKDTRQLYPFYLLSGAILMYFILGMFYLFSRRIRNWFD